MTQSSELCPQVLDGGQDTWGVEKKYDSFLQKCQLPNGDAAQTDTTLHVLNIREIVSSTKLSQLLSISDQLPKSR